MRKLAIIAAALYAVFAAAPGAAQSIRTVDELWRGFDPEALPLEVQTVSESEEKGLLIRKLFYTAEIAEGFKVRVIAYYGFPGGQTKLPAILHIHGGNQTANREYVEYWAKRGYACLSINWGGIPLDGDPSHGNTDWGPLNVSQTNRASLNNLRPDARANGWFHWTIACRRGITFLARQPEVDPSRIGAFGVSRGGRLIWLVAGIDHRLRTAVSVYGAVKMSDPLPGIPNSANLHLSPDDAAVWRGTLDAMSYAPRIQCPFFFLGAADDYYGAMDFVDDAIEVIPHQDKWESFSPNFRHHVEPAQSAALPVWMDRWLKGAPAWPKAPQLRVRLDAADHVPSATLSADQPERVKSVSIFYSEDEYPESRYWRLAGSAQEAANWRARLPLTETEHGLYAFANVVYDSGLSLSTRLASTTASGLQQAGVIANDPPTLVFDDFSQGGAAWFALNASANPLLGDKRWFEVERSTDGTPVLACDGEQGRKWHIQTLRIGDAKWRGPAGAALRLRVLAARPNTLVVSATENDTRRGKPEKVFVAKAVLRGVDWQTITLPQAAFQTVDGSATLSSWNQVNLLGIQGQYIPDRVSKPVPVGDVWQGPLPRIGRIEWIPASEK